MRNNTATNEIKLSVLAYMITNGVRNTTFVNFVELAPLEQNKLKELCEGRFQILGSEMMEKTPLGYRLRGSNTPGEFLYVIQEKIHGDGAEAEGRYSAGTSTGTAFFHYRLRRIHGTWHVVLCKIVGGT